MKQILTRVFCAVGIVVFAMTSAQLALADGEMGRKYAILVGVKEYDRNQLKNLPFAENDVAEMADILKQSGFRRVELLTQARGAKESRYLPLAKTIRESIKGVLEDRGNDDLVLIAFAGHGVQFKGEMENYFCPMDAVLTDRSTLISLTDIYDQLKQSKAGSKLLLVDACRNDPLAGNARAAGEVDLQSLTRPQLPDPPGGVAAFFSCSAGQRAFEDEGLKHGVFFHHVILGLKGEAKLQKREEVTWDSLVAYVKSEVPDTVKTLYGHTTRQTPENKGELRGQATLITLNSIVRPKSALSNVPSSMEKSNATKDAALLKNPKNIPGSVKEAKSKFDPKKSETIFSGHEGKVTAVTFLESSNLLITGSNSQTRVFDGKTNVNNPGSDNTVRAWSLTTGKEVFTVKDGLGQKYTWGIKGVALSPDKTQFAVTACRPGADWCMATLTVWSTNSQSRLHHFPLPGRPGVWKPWFDVSGNSIFAFRFDTTVHQFDLKTGNEISKQKLDKDASEGSMQSVCMSNDRLRVFCGMNTGVIRQWKVADGNLVGQYSGHTNVIRSLGLSSDDKHLASASNDHTVRVWDTITGSEIANLQHESNVTSVAFVPGEMRVVTGTDDKYAILWDIPTGAELTRFKGHTDAILALTVSADGRFLATGSADKTARLWPMSNIKP